MTHRLPESASRLARERAPGPIGDGPRDHEARGVGTAGQRATRSDDGGLGVERVEDGLDEQEIDPTVDQRENLLAVGRGERVEVERAIAGILHSRRHRQRDVGWADRPCDEASTLVGCRFVGDATRDASGLEVEISNEVREAVLRLGDRG